MRTSSDMPADQAGHLDRSLDGLNAILEANQARTASQVGAADPSSRIVRWTTSTFLDRSMIYTVEARACLSTFVSASDAT